MKISILPLGATARSFSLLAVLALPAAGAAPFAVVGEPGVEAPEGLGSDDWSSIRAAYGAGRHAACRVEQGYRVRNPGQRWQTDFDGRGFTIRPDAGGWTWGLELSSYGVAGAERACESPASVSAHGARVTYAWHPALEEWYLNDGRGLEHGYTLHQRPAGRAGDETPGPLQLTLAVRGMLEPSLHADGRDMHFVDSTGAAVLTYSGLTAFDANGARLPAHFEIVGAGLLLSIDDTGAAYPLTIDPVAQQAYLKASNTDAGDLFGHGVAVSGDTVVVGAYLEDSNATGVNGDQGNNAATTSGAAYVFVRNGTSWSQQAYLKASNTDAGDRFGFSVSISGDTLVVGAPEEESPSTGVDGGQGNGLFAPGAAYVFVRNGTTWSQQAYLKASNTGNDDQFGWAVSVSGDVVAVATPHEDSNATGVNGNQDDNSLNKAGAAYVFVRNGTAWSQQAYLKASNTGEGDNFGGSVSVSGDTVLVGALGEDSNATGVNGDQGNGLAAASGAAYVFVRNGTTWSQQAYLKASNTGVNDLFGASVSVSADTVVVGAFREDSNATGVNGDQGNTSVDPGAAYVFVRSGAAWTQQAYLKASNTGAFDEFGYSVSVSGDSAVIGARHESSNATGVNGDQGNEAAAQAGAAYVFARSGTAWSPLAYLKASNTGANDEFGVSVSVSGDTALIGASGENSAATGANGDQGDNSATSAGAAYLYVLDAAFEQYCHQSLPTSVPGCFAQLSAHDPSLATGTWDATQIPRSDSLLDGNSLGIYVYTHGLGLGQSAVSATVPFGTLCLAGFKRSAPSCAPVSLPTLAGACNPGVMSLALACNSGALGLAVGEDVNVQLWYRDPSGGGGGEARYSNAIFYTIQ